MLLIDKGHVYYRVNRSLLKATLGQDGPGEPELLVEDDRVPDIHWAFMGPAQPLEKISTIPKNSPESQAN